MIAINSVILLFVFYKHGQRLKAEKNLRTAGYYKENPESEVILKSSNQMTSKNAMFTEPAENSEIKDYTHHTKLWALVTLGTIFAHIIILLTMIIRFPFYGTHWIVFGINMFNMITCNFSINKKKNVIHHFLI